jgi:hypothetical protein
MGRKGEGKIEEVIFREAESHFTLRMVFSLLLNASRRLAAPIGLRPESCRIRGRESALRLGTREFAMPGTIDAYLAQRSLPLHECKRDHSSSFQDRRYCEAMLPQCPRAVETFLSWDTVINNPDAWALDTPCL